MSQSETMATDTGKADEPAALTDKDLEAVSGGMVDLKGLGDSLTGKAQQIQQVVQQMQQQQQQQGE